MRKFTAALAFSVAVSFLAACGGNSFNVDDARFVSRMMPHHQLGMTLINEAVVKSHDVRLRNLVFEMGGYHDSEMKSLMSWATRWNVSEADSFPGEISSADLGRLSAMTGSDYDTVWLDLMITHHVGAVKIATEELRMGHNGGATAMAQEVLTSQQLQINEMRDLLKSMCTASHTAGC